MSRMKNGYIFRDTFNDRVISRHRSVETAVQANINFNRKFEKNNSVGSYLPVSIDRIENGKIVAHVLWDWPDNPQIEETPYRKCV